MNRNKKRDNNDGRFVRISIGPIKIFEDGKRVWPAGYDGPFTRLAWNYYLFLLKQKYGGEPSPEQIAADEVFNGKFLGIATGELCAPALTKKAASQ